MNRRHFLKLMGGAAAVAVAAPLLLPAAPVLARPTAPLYVPSNRLAFGVPSQRLVTAREAATADLAELWEQQVERYQATQDRAIAPRVPMMLLEAQYLHEYGGHIQAGTEVAVDRETAARWQRLNIAVPGRRASVSLQEETARRIAEMRRTDLGGRLELPWSSTALPDWRNSSLPPEITNALFREMLRA